MAARGGGVRPGEGPGGSSPPQSPEATAAASTAAATVLGNCARCGSGDRLKFCSRCQVVRYCSSDCQKTDVSGRGGGGIIIY